MFLILYVDNILLIWNDIEALSTIKILMSNHFDMDLGEDSYILGIKFLRGCRNKMLGLFQASYIDNILVKFATHNLKKGLLPFWHGTPLSKEQCPKSFD